MGGPGCQAQQNDLDVVGTGPPKDAILFVMGG